MATLFSATLISLRMPTFMVSNLPVRKVFPH
jgi:hypothetical protein